MALTPVLLTLVLAQAATPVQELKFAWPEGVVVTVDVERTTEARSGASDRQPKRTLVRGRYRMTVLPHEQGRLIRYDRYEVTEPKVLRHDDARFSQAFQLFPPAILVSPTGAFLRLEGVPDFRAALEAVFGAKDLIDGMILEEMLAATAAADWETHIGIFTEVPVGRKKVDIELQLAMPADPGDTIPVKASVSLVGQRQCTRAGATRPCVTLEMRSRIDTATAKAAAESGSFDDRSAMRVTLETDTMLPHETVWTKTSAMKIPYEGEVIIELTTVERVTRKFTYAAGK